MRRVAPYLMAVVGSLAAFLLYDYFFMPPVGTLTVSGPRELLELILLLAVALVTGQLAASLHRTQSSAETLALESRALYDLATAALRLSDVTTALALVCERAMQLASVETRRTVTVEGRAVKLTPTEYELLRYLALHVGKPVTHTTLLRWVWGEYAVGDKYNTRYVVAQIRKELGDDPSNPKYIVNEPGVGYRLQA